MKYPFVPDGTTVHTVSQITDEVRKLLEQGFAAVWVEGEISNLARPTSGHIYFTLKDADASLRAALYRTQRRDSGRQANGRRPPIRRSGRKGRRISTPPRGVLWARLPAGTGHQCLGASDDFLVIGAYPPNGTYDECTKSEDRKAALKTIPRVGRPRKDPVYGSDGPLRTVWRAQR